MSYLSALLSVAKESPKCNGFRLFRFTLFWVRIMMVEKDQEVLNHMEIERKFLIHNIEDLPFSPEDHPHREIEQGYLCTEPVVRIRKDGQSYFLTYKSKGLMVREEYNLPLTEEGYLHLKEKIDGRLISKTRYVVPLENGLSLELDIFKGDLVPLILAEIEFPDEETASSYTPPAWLGEDVTFSTRYHNSTLSKC